MAGRPSESSSDSSRLTWTMACTCRMRVVREAAGVWRSCRCELLVAAIARGVSLWCFIVACLLLAGGGKDVSKEDPVSEVLRGAADL